MASAAAAAAQQIFRSEADLTHFGVTVVDRRGESVPHLTADDFEILEDGKPQVIRYFARGVDGSAPDLHAGIMLDTSESMAADRDLSHSAAIKFLNRLPEAKDLTLLDFDTEIRLGRFSQDDFPRLVERIRSRKAEGYTALYDAFFVYLDRSVAVDGRSVLVALTDGGDSRSTTSFAAIVDTVRASTNVTIYVIGFVENQSPSMRLEQQVRLSRIAEESGGIAIFPYSMKQIESAYDRIATELRSQYSLGYVSTNTRRDGRWRKVKIRIRRPELKDLRVRTREGYFGPYSPPPR
jgi:Ca-activated chloride channel family protein